MRYQVPQYIEVEDKIGPLTFKQYIYVGGALGLSFLIYYFVPVFLIAIILIIPVLALGGALAFYQHNNRPFIFLLESLFYYMLGEKLYIWKKAPKKETPKKLSEALPKDPQIEIPRVTQGNLHNLATKLDMKEAEDNIADRL